MKTLDDYALFHRADKASDLHGYTRWYERHFAKYVSTSFTLLEIGIAYSNSLLTWRDYFGRQANIVGVELEAEFCNRATKLGFEIHHGDVSDKPFLAGVIDKVDPDIVIDDGSHNAVHQRAAFETIYPKLKNGALYVIEDLHAAYWGWGGHFMKDLLELVNKVNQNGKSTQGNVRNEPKALDLDPLEANTIAMHFYPSIVFIEKENKWASPLP